MSELIVLTTSPGGKRERAKLHNRRVILDAAREVFGELGYEAASVRDIIRRTGLSVGSFYNYYRSKEEVYAALASDGATRFAPILKAQFDAATDFESYLRGAISAYFCFMVSQQGAWRAQRPEGESYPPPVRADTPELEAVYDQVRWSIAEALTRERSPPVDIEYLAAACIAVAREIGEKMLDRRPIKTAEAVEFTVHMILGGLRGLPPLTA